MTAPRPEAEELAAKLACVLGENACTLDGFLVAATLIIDAAHTAARADERERILALIENPSEDDDGIWRSSVINGRAACEYLAAAIRAMEGR